MVKVFDLDGTLLDSNGIWAEVDQRFVAQFGKELTEEYNRYVAHAIFPDAARFTKQYYQLDISEAEIMAQWKALAYRAYAEELPLKAGAERYLDKCRSAGERIALYTSSEPSLCMAALRRHGIDIAFEHIFFAQELGLEKRYAESFAQISQLLDVPPDECVLLDDSPVAWVSAKSAGWHVIGVHDKLFEAQQVEKLSLCERYIHVFCELI